MKHFDRFRIGILVLVLILANVAVLPKAFAGTLTHSSVIELNGGGNPMIASATNELAIAFTTASVTATNPSITITFPAGFTINATQTVSNTGCTALTGASAGIPGTLAASGSGQVITIASSGGSNSLAATTSYCTELTSTTAVTNTATPGVYSVVINDSVDSQTDGIDILSTGQNAYSITATVAPSFTLALSGTTDSIATLSPTALKTSTGITATVVTNAASGWFLWAKDSNAGLTSTSAGSHNIPTVSTGSNHTMNGGTIGTEAYALGVTTNNTANYAYGGGTTGGGLSTTVYNEIATSGSPTNSATSTLNELVDIAGTTPPATDYTDTITVIGAGSF